MKRLLLLLLSLPVLSNAQDLHFATLAEAREVLSARDEFVVRMSPFDRASRLKTDREVTEAQYLEFAASHAQEWNAGERERINAAWKEISPAITRLRLPLPRRVVLVKTTGVEEGGAAYTRGRAIMFPPKMLAAPEAQLRHVLAHETFHVATRDSPALAKSLYATIGFTPCIQPPLSAEQDASRITNPDAPRNNYCISLKAGDQAISAMPVLLADPPRYDVAKGGEFFQYLQLRFLWVTPPENAGKLSALNTLAGYFEQIGRNTEYIIHPEEVLAENFAMLVNGKSGKSPEVLRRIEAALAGAPAQ